MHSSLKALLAPHGNDQRARLQAGEATHTGPTRNLIMVQLAHGSTPEWGTARRCTVVHIAVILSHHLELRPTPQDVLGPNLNTVPVGGTRRTSTRTQGSAQHRGGRVDDRTLMGGYPWTLAPGLATGSKTPMPFPDSCFGMHGHFSGSKPATFGTEDSCVNSHGYAVPATRTCPV